MKRMRHSLKVEATKETLFNLNYICVSSCGKYLFCVLNNLVNIVDIQTGLIEHSLESEEEEISTISLSPNDEHLITAHSSSLLLKQWSNWKQFPAKTTGSNKTTTQKCTRTWKALHTAPIVHMSFDSSSTLLATSSSDYTTKIWDLNGQYCTHNLKGANGITRCAKFYPDLEKKQEIVLGGDDAKLRVFDLNTSRLVECLDGHFSVVTCFEYVGDNFEQFLSASRDKVMILWDMNTYAKLRTIPTFESIESFQIVLDPKYHVITMGNEGLLKLWSLETGRLVYSQEKCKSLRTSRQGTNSDLDTCIIQSVFVKASNMLVLVTVDEAVVFVLVDSSVKDYDKNLFHVDKQFIGNHGEILDVKFVDFDEKLLAVATNSPDLKIYDINNWDCKILKGHTDLVICLAVFKNTTTKKCYLASSSKNSEIRIWELGGDESSFKFECIQVCLGHTQDVGALCFSKQSSSLDFLVSGSIDTTIKVWRCNETMTKTTPKLNVAFTFKAHDKDINCVSVSPNDKLIASASSDKTAKIWNSTDGSCLAVLRGHRRGIWSVDFSTVEQMIATCSADATIKIWSLTDFACLKTFEGHNTSVLKVFFLNHSTQLISSASDGLLKLWNIKASTCVATFDEHNDKCWSLLISDSKGRVISGAADGKLIVWRDVSDELFEEELEQREEVLLQEQELENFMMEKNWKKALLLALVLDKPFKCYSIIKEILESNLGRTKLEKALLTLRDDQIRSLLKYSADWNTNTKFCHIAQTVFEIIVRNYSPDVLINGGTNNDFVVQLIQQFLPYTERHNSRINKLAQQITFIDFTWKNMKLDENENNKKT